MQYFIVYTDMQAQDTDLRAASFKWPVFSVDVSAFPQLGC